MIKIFLRKIVDMMQWMFDSLLTSKQRHFIKHIFSEKQKRSLKRLFKDGKRQKQLWEIDRMRYRLRNLGFTKKAYLDLKQACHHAQDEYMRRLSAWELALWHANQYSVEDAHQCLVYLPLAIQGEKRHDFLVRAAILEAESLVRIGSIDEARGVLSRFMSSSPSADLFLAAANLEEKDTERVYWVNKALALYDISNISVETSSHEATSEHSAYDSIVSVLGMNSRGNKGADAPKVSVIIPVYNAQDVIQTSIDAILAQTWDNLEVLVVDDCSTDGTLAIIQDYAQRDARVQLIQASSNGGAYVARNLALQVATGEFVTVNDADDWSHPLKIEQQITHLLQNTSVIGNTSQQARATNDLTFHRRGKPGTYIFSNMSSLMFRREPVLESVGYWDCVRFGADSEFIKRVRLIFGEKAVVELSTGPLSFQRQSSNSLTGNAAFGFPGYFMGARKEYAEAQKQFHSVGHNLRYDFPQNVRPFAIPEPMWPIREEKLSERRHFDVIIVSDFRLDGGSTMSNAEEIKAQHRMGIRTGLIQLSRYDYSPKKKIHPQIRELVDGNLVQVIVYGEKVSCDLMILRYPPILQEWQRFVPDVHAGVIHVIVNQTPMSDYGPNAERRYDLNICEERLQDYFGQPGTWYPIGPLVREALHQHHAKELDAIQLTSEDWSNIIDVDEWKRPSRPVPHSTYRIGRHSRGQAVKWPADSTELLKIYPDSNQYDVHILGGAEAPQKILGRLPSNWHVLHFGHMHPKDFLATLDVFVYYTHPDWVESFGRVIIEAMAVGVPVIIPPIYRELFGDAAIYAQPSEVQETVDQLMSDSDYYTSQVQKSHLYVDKHFGYSKHETRLEEFLNG